MRSAVMAATLVAMLGSAGAVRGNDLPHRGAFTCDFELLNDAGVPPDVVAGVIDHDRQLMSSADAAKGFKHKVLPLAVDPATGRLFSGGRYLFDKWVQARSYAQFVKEDFQTFDPASGQTVQFLQRSTFKDPDCRSWLVIGAAEFSDFRTTQYHLRTERWSIPSPDGTIVFLESRWPFIRHAAKQIPGVSAVWLLVNLEDRLVSIVYFQDRLAPFPGAGMDELMSAPSVLAGYAASRGWTLAYVAGHLALNVWLPFQPGDHGAAALWPNADAIPVVPSSSDGVCSPSRGETSASDGACLPSCGNAACDPGETWLNCPADVSSYRGLPPACAP